MNKLIKTAALVAIMAGFGAVSAQVKVDDTVKQTQKPSSGTMPAPASPATTPKVDDAVKQTQKPSSGLMPTTMPAASGVKVDDTVAQTQKPGVAANGPEKKGMTKAEKKAMKDMAKKDKPQ